MSTITPIDEMLNRLEEDIRKLKIEFDIFFNGGTAKPPVDFKYRVESMIKRLYDARGMSFGQRFRYNTLVSRFNVYQELWRRHLKQREEGGREVKTLLPGEGPGFAPATVRCADPQAEPEKVRQLYDNLLMAKQAVGESVSNLPFDRFEQMISAQVSQIKNQLKCDAVAFTVEVEEGSVKFKAKALR